MKNFESVEEWLYYLSSNHDKIERMLCFDYCDTFKIEDEYVTVRVEGGNVIVMDGVKYKTSYCNPLILESYLHFVKNSDSIERVSIGGVI